jgi:hypothetical protein
MPKAGAFSATAELPASKLHAEQVIQRPAFPIAAPKLPLALAKTTRDAENEGPGEIRASVRQHVGCVRHHNAALATRLDVDVVVADGDVRDDLQIARGVEHWTVDAIGEQAHERLLAFDTRDQLVVRYGRSS